MVYAGSLINDLDVTPHGILMTPMSKVLELAQSKNDLAVGVKDNFGNDILNNNVVWRYGSLEDGVFKGLFIVFGKGYIYLYCTTQKNGVDFQEVLTNGQNMGFFTDDAIDVIVQGLDSDDYTIFVVLEYHNQLFGPYPRNVRDR